MAVDNDGSERRREHRKKVKITVLLKMGVLLNGRGIARDISKGGMCLVSPQIFKTMTTIQAKEFEGAPLRVMIPTEALTVNGIIAWVDLKKGKVPSASRAPRTTTSGSVCAASRRFSRVPSSSARTLHPPGGLLLRPPPLPARHTVRFPVYPNVLESSERTPRGVPAGREALPTGRHSRPCASCPASSSANATSWPSLSLRHSRHTGNR